MLKAVLDKRDNDIVVSGILNSETVVPLMHLGYQWIEKLLAPVFNFSGVTQADSMGLAMLISWMRYAKKQGKKLTYTHLPQAMVGIAQACRLKDILSLRQDDNNHTR
jgi:phospholipid transport system transporter-binding protein